VIRDFLTLTVVCPDANLTWDAGTITAAATTIDYVVNAALMPINLDYSFDVDTIVCPQNELFVFADPAPSSPPFMFTVGNPAQLQIQTSDNAHVGEHTFTVNAVDKLDTQVFDTITFTVNIIADCSNVAITPKSEQITIPYPIAEFAYAEQRNFNKDF